MFARTTQVQHLLHAIAARKTTVSIEEFYVWCLRVGETGVLGSSVRWRVFRRAYVDPRERVGTIDRNRIGYLTRTVVAEKEMHIDTCELGPGDLLQRSLPLESRLAILALDAGTHFLRFVCVIICISVSSRPNWTSDSSIAKHRSRGSPKHVRFGTRHCLTHARKSTEFFNGRV